MKVLMVVTWYTDIHAEKLLAGVFHYEQSMALKPYADMALFFPYDHSIEGTFSKEEEWGLLTYRSRAKSGPLGRVQRFNDFIKVVKDFDPDIIHAHVGQTAGRWAVMVGKLLKKPVVITEHQPMELMNLENKKCFENSKVAYEKSLANICVSKDSMERLSEYFPDAGFRVIYNGIMNPENEPDDGEKYRVDGFTNCSIVAAFYSKDIKGYQYLIPAIKNLKDEGVKIRLHIVGGGDFFEYYKQMAEDLGLKEECIFYGQCDRKKVYSILRQMDFSVSASIFECSGVSVQEAMLLGKPLVVTKSGGANSLVTEDTAIVVDRESIDALVFGIREMIKRKDDFKEETIKAYAFENFEIDRVSRRYMDLYEKILEQKKGI